MPNEHQISDRNAELKECFLSGVISNWYFADRNVKFSTQTSRPYLVGTRQQAERPFLSSGGILATLWTSINRATQKIQYGKYSPREWTDHYIFPDRDAQNRAHEIYISRSHDCIDFEDFQERIINQSRTSSELWLEQIVKQAASVSLNDQPKISFLTGGIGAGKSTFIKYMLGTTTDLFLSSKVIPSRIEHAKLKKDYINHSKENNTVSGTDKVSGLGVPYEYLILHIKRRLVRDFCIYHWGVPDHSGTLQYKSITPTAWDDIKEDLLVKFRDYVSMDGDSSKAFIDKGISIISAFLRSASKNRNEAAGRVHNLPEFAVDLILFLADKLNYKFLPIFDGFDRIEGSELIFSHLCRKTLHDLAAWLFRDESKITLSLIDDHAIKMNSVVCLRTNTVTYFETQIHAHLAYPRTNYEFVVAPLVTKVVEGVVNQIVSPQRKSSDHVRDTKNRLVDICNGLFRALLKECKGAEPADWVCDASELFNDNVRNQLHFLRDILVTALDEVRRADRKQLNSHGSGSDLMVDFEFRLTQYCLSRSYRVFVIYLSSDKKIFTNFLSFDNENLEEMLMSGVYLNLFDSRLYSEMGVCADNDEESGYVDNLFNYHFHLPSTRSFGEFLEKIRICQILSISKSPLNIVQLTERLRSYFSYSGESIGISLAILVRGGFVACYMDAPPGERRGLDQLSYALEPLGQMALRHLIYKSEYLETVFHQMLLPVRICEASDDVVRQAPPLSGQLINVGDELNRWIAASIKHSFLVCNLVDYVEKENPPVDSSLKIGTKLRQCVWESIDRVVQERERNDPQWRNGTMIDRILEEIKRLIS